MVYRYIKGKGYIDIVGESIDEIQAHDNRRESAASTERSTERRTVESSVRIEGSREQEDREDTGWKASVKNQHAAPKKESPLHTHLNHIIFRMNWFDKWGWG